MTIWNKVLIGLIIALLLVFFYMAARTLKTHQHWREAARKNEERLADLRKENQELLSGSEDGTKRGIRQLQLAIDELVIDRNRGRVWYDCKPQQANAETGQVRVATDKPSPHGIAPKTLLYVFEQTEESQGVSKGGHYIGQFEVEVVDEALRLVALKPARKMTLRELQRLAKSKGPWAMYEIMPADEHDIFAGLSEDEKKQILPQETLADYLNDGQPATWEQMAKWGVAGTLVDDEGKALVDEKGKPKAGAKGTFVRQLRNYGRDSKEDSKQYQSLFQWYDMERTRLFDLLQAAERDKNYMQAAAADAKQDVQFRRHEIAALKADLAKYQKERDAVVACYKALQQKVAELKAAVLQTIRDNQALASQIAKIQLDASRQIDQQLRKMAQSAEGRK
jgi:hypothetical protein